MLFRLAVAMILSSLALGAIATHDTEEAEAVTFAGFAPETPAYHDHVEATEAEEAWLRATESRKAAVATEQERIRDEETRRREAERAAAEAAAEAEAKRQREAEAAARASAAAAPAIATGSVWDRLAKCESNGEWNYGPHSGWGSGIYEGGLQFHPRTWDAYRPSGYPDAAYKASREQQIAVAEKVLAAQGWGAWPACSRKLGLR